MTHIDYDGIAEIYDLYASTEVDVPFFVEEATRVSGPVLELRFAIVERDELEAMAGETGFRVVSLFGGYDRSAFAPETSPSMIFVLERAGSAGVS